jgi:predicted O-linked N-acetylglucosamine transferase (SPINDLY family)
MRKRPTNPSQALKLGLQLHQLGRLDQAASHYRAVLAAQPSHFDAMHLLGLLRFQQGRHAEAADRIGAALKLKPAEAAALSNFGLVLAALGRLEEALASFDKALANKPGFAEALNNRGTALLRLRRTEEALASFDQALAIRPGDAEALNNRGNCLLELKRPEDALASFDRALALRPDHAEALYSRASTLLSLKRPSEALASFDKVLALTPGHAGVLSNRGNCLLELKRPEEALASFDKALAIEPDFAEALNNRGNTLLDLRRPEEALASFDKALTIKPDYAEALANRGIALVDLKRTGEALATFDKALAIKPGFAEVLYNRGNCLLELKRPEEALASFDKALAIKADFADVLYNRGNCLLELRRPEEALASFDKALAIAPDHADAHNNRGSTLNWLLRPAEALASFDRALAIKPDDPATLHNRGKTLLDLGRAAEAVTSLDRALAIKPDNPEALNCHGIALVDLKRPEEALASFDKALAIKPDDGDVISGQLNAALQACRWTRVKDIAGRLVSRKTWRTTPIIPFIMLVCSDDPSVHLECARPLVPGKDRNPTQEGEPGAPAVWSHRPRPERKLKIAYISADYRVHPVAALISGLFELHDRVRFEIFGISTGVDDRSEMRLRIAKAFDRFLDVRYRSDEEIARLLKELQIDIAVDLTGHTRDCRLGILAGRPAPVQASYLGYPGTTGADFIDYVIADPIILPFDQQPFYTERIVHLPDSYQVNDAKRLIAPGIPTRQACRLPEEAFVFCCFNNNYKITPDIFDVWMRLLVANPGSVLWLFRDNADAERNLREAAHERGVDAARLVFAELLPHREHLARHRRADLFLDTLPYNAHTTASDALWVGLPLLTCTGRSFASRVAASLLHAADLPELVTHSIADYEALAMRLAADPALLQGYKQRLEENRHACALFDTARFTRHIEAAYVRMWEIFQRGEAPQAFSVSGQ